MYGILSRRVKCDVPHELWVSGSSRWIYRREGSWTNRDYKNETRRFCQPQNLAVDMGSVACLSSLKSSVVRGVDGGYLRHVFLGGNIEVALGKESSAPGR